MQMSQPWLELEAPCPHPAGGASRRVGGNKLGDWPVVGATPGRGTPKEDAPS
jgi:hypothetical protein